MITAVFLLFNVLGIFFFLLPSGWHYQVRNTSTLLYIFWCAVTIIPAAVNSVVWYGAAQNVAPVWCDIVTKIRIGGEVGIPAATLCITRQLEAIAAARHVHSTAGERRRRVWFDIAIGLGLPVFVMTTHVIVQGHRFDIIQRVGCVPTVYWSFPAIFLIGIWPILLYAIAALYAGLAIRLFIVRRTQFSKILASSQSAITTGRFVRLIALSTIVIVINLPLVAYVFVNNLLFQTIKRYPSWFYVHFNFDYVHYVSAADWDAVESGPRMLAELSWWISPLACALFFVFFGIGEESLNSYQVWGHWIIGRMQLVLRFPFARKCSPELTLSPPMGSQSGERCKGSPQKGQYVETPCSSSGVAFTVERHELSEA